MLYNPNYYFILTSDVAFCCLVFFANFLSYLKDLFLFWKIVNMMQLLPNERMNKKEISHIHILPVSLMDNIDIV